MRKFLSVFILLSCTVFCIEGQKAGSIRNTDFQFLSGSIDFKNISSDSLFAKMIESGVSVEHNDSIMTFCLLISKYDKEAYADFFMYNMYRTQEIKDGEFIALMMSYLSNAKRFCAGSGGSTNISLSDFDITNILWCLEKYRQFQKETQ